jgi:5-methylcytosine-specific restriction enzyme subunit McrC
MKPSIPIKNLYYLLIYAYDALDTADIVDAEELPATNLVDLFAHVLDAGIVHLLRRGIGRNYVPHRDELPGLRGRIDLSATLKSGALARGRLVCDHDELTADILHNQILRTTVRRLLHTSSLAQALVDRLSATYRHLMSIAEISLSTRVFRRVQLHRNNQFYRFLLMVCRLVHEALLPQRSNEGAPFRNFTEDDRKMARLFEKFIRNFYRREQTHYSVRGGRFPWAKATGALDWLPQMTADVRLESAHSALVLDAKYYREAFQTRFNKRSLRSTHLYQIYAYIRNLADQDPIYSMAEGILIYPVTSEPFTVSVQLGPHSVRAAGLDLSQDWQAIRRDLLRLVGLPFS